jgi:hypothetical protein
VTWEEYELGRQVSDAEYAWLQAKVMTAAFTRAEYDRLWAAARVRGEPPRLQDLTYVQSVAGVS